MKLTREVILAAPFDQVAANLRRPALMQAVARPVVDIRSAEPGGYPAEWPGGPYRTSLWLLGVLPMGPQIVDVSWLPAPAGEARMRDNGRGPIIKRWDHRITVADAGQGRTRYRDELEIGAGVLTPLVWAAAQILFIWRQRQLVRIAAAGFPLPETPR